MIIPSEYIYWFKAGMVVGLNISFFIWIILEAYWKEIDDWINKILSYIR